MLCRLCLSSSSEDGKSLFSEDFDRDKSMTPILMLISKYMNLDITPNDAISTKVCLECWNHLNDFDRFCKHIEKQQNMLYNESALIKYEIEMADYEADEALSPRDITASYAEPYMNQIQENEEIFIDTKDICEESTVEEADGQTNSDGLTENLMDIYNNSEDDEPLLEVKSAFREKQPINNSKEEKTIRSAIENEATKPKRNKAEIIRKSDEFISSQMQLVCDICNLEEETYSGLLEHYRSEHNCRGYIKCCNRILKERAHLVDHIKYHLNPAEFECSVCHALLKSTYNLNTHMLKMHAINNYKRAKPKKVEICESEKDDDESINASINELLDEPHNNLTNFSTNDTCNDTNDSNYEAMNNDYTLDDLTNDRVNDFIDDEFNDASNDPTYGQENIETISSIRAAARKRKREEIRQNDEFIASNIVLKCDICDETLDTFILLVEHFRNEHNCTGYIKCCDRKWKSRPLLTDHLKYHVNPQEYPCDHCKRFFISQYDLSKHMILTHATEEQLKYQCTKCDKRFSIYSNWARHSASHITERNMSCKLCDKTFKHKYGLAKHMKNVHTSQEESFICNYCGEKFTSKYNFRRHITKHEGTLHKPQQCAECGVWLRSRANLRVHMQIHNPNPSGLKCKLCDRTFPLISALKSHIRYMHQKQAQFSCTVCEKAFKSKVNLQEHIAKHTGEKLYTCPHCPKEFRSGANMSKHIKKNHPKEWSMRTVQSRRREIYKNVIKAPEEMV